MDKKKPLISVAMCTYNGEHFLHAQIDSILGQTYPHLEIVIVDDCSTDSTPDIINNYAKKDPRIRFIRNESNIGFIRNFQRALENCHGSLIALADQDDIWLPEKITTLHQEIEDNLMIYSAVKLMDADGTPIKKPFPNVRRIDGSCALSLLLGNCVTGHACLLRQELLEKALPFPTDILSHDQWLALVAAAQGRLRASNQALSWYRSHDNNALLSSKKKKRRNNKGKKALAKNSRLLALGQALQQIALLEKPDQTKLEEYLNLLERNRHVFYNYRLDHFLRRYKSDFLRLYNSPDNRIKKACRGYWYYYLNPFA